MKRSMRESLLVAAATTLLTAPVAAQACSMGKQAMDTGVQVAQLQDKATDAAKGMQDQATDAAKDQAKDTMKEHMPGSMPSASGVETPAMPTTPSMPDAPKMPEAPAMPGK